MASDISMLAVFFEKGEITCVTDDLLIVTVSSWIDGLPPKQRSYQIGIH